MRTSIVAANWKMNKNHMEARELALGVIEKMGSITGAEVVVCPPFTSLQAVSEVIDETNISLGGQDMFWEPEGAYTGEISANMLLTLGCRYVILGHSERRTYFHETDSVVNFKVKAALKYGLIPIVCVGETREQRERNETEGVVVSQVKGSLQGISGAEFDGSVIAYEPLWAIGTGLNATPQQAQDVHRLIRRVLKEIFGNDIAERTRIQYGGSLKPSNARELFSEQDIDGGLVGGASLEADSFAQIVNASLSSETFVK